MSLPSPALSSPPLVPVPAPTVRLLYVGFGGTGPALPPGVPNAWIAALAEVSSTGADLTGLRVATLVLLDAQGAVVARATAPVDVRLAPRGRDPHDLSETGTTPFAGTVAAGSTVILCVHAPLDARLEALAKGPAVTQARIEVVTAGGASAQAQAPAFEWSTG